MDKSMHCSRNPKRSDPVVRIYSASITKYNPILPIFKTYNNESAEIFSLLVNHTHG